MQFTLSELTNPALEKKQRISLSKKSRHSFSMEIPHQPTELFAVIVC